MSEPGRTVYLFRAVSPANVWAVRALLKFGSVWIYRSSLDPECERRLLEQGARKVDFAASDDVDMGYVYGDFKGIASRVRARTRHTGIGAYLIAHLERIAEGERKLEAIRLGIIINECRDIQKIICWAQSVDGFDRVRIVDGLNYLEYLFISESQSRVVAGRANTLLGLMSRVSRIGAGLRRLLRRRAPVARADAGDTAIWGLRRLDAAAITPVVYFPHMTIAYGNLFLKEQFYSYQPGSRLYPGNILHVEHIKLSNTRFLDRVNRFYKDHGVESVALPDERRGARIRRFVRLVAALAWRYPRSCLPRHSSYYLLAKRIVNYQFYCRLLERFDNTSVALIGYEILFPKELYLALETRGIKTAAVQERLFASSFYDDFPFFIDYYFAAGEAVAAVLRQRREIVAGKVIPVGLVRSDLVCRDSAAPGADMVLCLDFVSWSSEQRSRLDPMMNWTANAGFYDDILALATVHPDIEFVIRSRSLEWTELAVFSSLMERIAQAPNVTISADYSSYYIQYRLAAQARAVIAKHSSIVEECLARRVPVIVHDYTHNVRCFASAICDYSVAKLFAHDFEELQEKLAAALAGEWLSDDDWHRIHRFVGGGEPGEVVKARLVEHLERILDSETAAGQSAATR